MTYDNRDQVLHCDECPEHFEIDHKDSMDADDVFKRTMMTSRTAGWRSFKGPDGDYAHACPSCVKVWAENQRRKNV